jgi:type II secretory ATPase GspE/PulE/Tfp pilus assembly ATPase PilB-like protein
LKSEYVTEAGLFGARIATRPCLNGPWMAMRLLYDSGNLITLDDMGYLPEQIAAYHRLIHRTDGMVLLTGTTGSGKSTSIQTALKMLIEAMFNSINVVTVEDPIEYRIPGAQQTPLKEQWAEAISNLMRLDPDVLMVGEMRDYASALAAFQAALTGHGLWSTLHVNSAAASLQRLGDLGVDPNLYQDPSLVKGLINQSLTRRLCPKCKVPFLQHQERVAADLRSRIISQCVPEQVFLKGDGCSECQKRGIIGRTAIAEIIQPDLAFMRMFKEKGKAEAQQFWVREQGGITKNNHLIRRINEGMIDPSHGERDICALDEDLATVGAA